MPALIRDGAAVEIAPGQPFVDAHDISRPGNWLAYASAAERAEAGVRDIVEPPAAPEGKVHAPGALRVDGDRVVRGYAVEDAPLPAVPEQVPMWAAQAALKQAGAYDAINKAILGMESSNPPVFFAWTMGNFASRQSAFIATLGGQFGMTDPDIDAVFRAAEDIARVAG